MKPGKYRQSWRSWRSQAKEMGFQVLSERKLTDYTGTRVEDVPLPIFPARKILLLRRNKTTFHFGIVVVPYDPTSPEHLHLLRGEVAWFFSAKDLQGHLTILTTMPRITKLWGYPPSKVLPIFQDWHKIARQYIKEPKKIKPLGRFQAMQKS